MIQRSQFCRFQKLFRQPHFLPLSGHDSTFPDQIYNGKHDPIVMLVVYPDSEEHVDSKNGQTCPERLRELEDTPVQSCLGCPITRSPLKIAQTI